MVAVHAGGVRPGDDYLCVVLAHTVDLFHCSYDVVEVLQNIDGYHSFELAVRQKVGELLQVVNHVHSGIAF